jgi:predicted lipoprotein with Yx(FWY)xxD motif
MDKGLRFLLVVLVGLLVVAPVAAQDDMMDPLIVIEESEELGMYLTDAEGNTLYIFTNDGPATSNCTDGCLENWPALTVESAEELVAGDGVTGFLATIEREDTGEMQVIYNGQPLYYFVQDENPGDVAGQGVNDVWFVVHPATVTVGGNEELGRFLTDNMGMTLYIFTNDEEGVSNCTDGCLENWPALTVATEDALTAGIGVEADMLGTIEREDTGELQVTWDGMPLYYFVRDEAAGDATGEGVNDVWFVVEPTLVKVGGNEELGDFLVDGGGLTLYTFANDEPGVSNCTGGCLAAWPPLTVEAESDLEAIGEGVMGDFGVIEREDTGEMQVTYNEMPLYYWVRDAAPGDATGHNFRDVWFVVEQ